LFELDVTQARHLIDAHKAKTGSALSFTALLVSSLAQAIAQHPMMQAYRNWRNQLIVFDDVDVVTLIETEVDSVAVPHIIRAANRKTVYDISSEIRAIQSNPKRSAQKGGLLARLATRVPGLVRRLFYRVMLKNPHWLKQYTGTTVISSVGMFVQGGGWALAFLPFHTLGLTVGGIAEKPAVVDGQIVLHEYLCVTLSVDHDMVDGAAAARFAQCFKERLESGGGLAK
jgi:pyruvate/2-oxoglutarate dehydrogenase complex dihydrolipoamide acyltransferase (E2) component